MIKISPLIFREYQQLNKAQWLTQGQLEKLQWHRFKTILKYAFENTEFYHTRFKKAGITPADIKDKGDLQKIPITTREDLRNPKRLIATPYQQENLKFSMTSGSSGRRTTTFFDAQAWIKAKFLLKLRARLACGLRPWHKIAVFSELEAKNTFFKEVCLRQKSFSILDSPETHLPLLEKYNPSAMYGFPSAFSNLADYNISISPTLIFTSSEMLEARTRSKIVTAFSAKIFDVYGCTEVKEISWECPEHQGYHINSDWLMVEFLKNSQQSDREDASIIVTSLYNYGMPLIRYEIGDTGLSLSGKCACGRGLPLMAPSLGRSVDYFLLPNGALISPYKMTCAIEKVEGMKQYQLKQERKEKIVVKVVPQGAFGERNKENIISALQNILPETTIEIRCVNSIAKEKSGKYKIVVSDVSK